MNKVMNKVVEILMRRDGDSKQEATERVEQTRDELLQLGTGSFEDSQNIIEENLGLEPDYLFDILDV